MIRGEISAYSSDEKPATVRGNKEKHSMRNKYKITNEEIRMTVHQSVKQRQQTTTLLSRLSRYKKRQAQFRQNTDFANKPLNCLTTNTRRCGTIFEAVV